MTTIMIIFERDKPRIMITWTIVFFFTSIIGYVIYATARVIYYKKCASLFVKKKEDEIFLNLINREIYENKTENIADELFQFNSLAYNAKLTSNNYYEIINSRSKFKTNLIKDLKSASKYILLELDKVNIKDFIDIKQILIEKAQAGVVVKFLYDSLNNISFLKELKKAGIRVLRFSKHNTLGRIFSNRRNVIIIDGKVAYSGKINIKDKVLTGKYDVADVYFKLKGDIVQDMDIVTHKDVIFASQKYLDYNAPKQESYANECKIQYVTNDVDMDIELLLVKAISLAKHSIQIQLEEFIPTESIMSLLRFAINSNIDVKLMVPLKTNLHSKYYASRAYSKEVALMGANVYLYDGYIRFNAITVDSEYTITGSYTLDREHINSSLQNVMIFKDSKVVNYFNRMFEEGIDNSYRISNAKYLLLREKFFKNFI